MGSFVDTARTTTQLTGFEERGITYLVATNAGWFVHYPTNKVGRQFGMDQEILDDLSSFMESPTFVQPFLRHTAFEFWRKRFTTVTIPSS